MTYDGQDVADLIAAGDALIDDLSVLLAEDHIEAIAGIVGLSVSEHMAEWERVTAKIDPRL